MGVFRKDRLKMEDIAPELAKMFLRSIEPSKIEKLREFGIDPADAGHRLEIVMLSLFSLRVAIAQALERDKGITILLYIEQLLKVAYVDVLKLGTTDQFENVLKARYDEYEDNIQSIGLCFIRNIGTEDAALIYWANQTFGRVRLMYLEFLQGISAKYQIV